MDEVILLKKYENNRFIRPLLQLIPYGIGSAIDTLLITTLNRMRQERVEIFFTELSKGIENIDSSFLISNEDFVHKYILTMKYIMDTHQKEKIEMFARLLKNSLDEKQAVFNINIYEDFSKILNELSYREICALTIYESFFYTRQKLDDENELQFLIRFWNEFEEKIENELRISKPSVETYMIKISRTGCYKEVTGGYLDYDGGKGVLTPLYFELKNYIFDNTG
jgi:hypothetical protein